MVRKSTLMLGTFVKFGVYWVYVEQDKAIHKKHINVWAVCPLIHLL